MAVAIAEPTITIRATCTLLNRRGGGAYGTAKDTGARSPRARAGVSNSPFAVLPCRGRGVARASSCVCISVLYRKWPDVRDERPGEVDDC